MFLKYKNKKGINKVRYLSFIYIYIYIYIWSGRVQKQAEECSLMKHSCTNVA